MYSDAEYLSILKWLLHKSTVLQPVLVLLQSCHGTKQAMTTGNIASGKSATLQTLHGPKLTTWHYVSNVA